MKQAQGSNSPTAPSDHGSRGDTPLECPGTIASEDVCGRAHDPSKRTNCVETRGQAVRALIGREGPLVSAQRLKALMGLNSDEALNRAMQRESTALTTFRLSDGAELLALTAEVGWLLQQGKPRGSRGLCLAIREGTAMSE
jgi:hypothetical protein